MASARWRLSCVLALWIAGCGDDGTPPPPPPDDAARLDTGIRDAAMDAADAGGDDAGIADAAFDGDAPLCVPEMCDDMNLCTMDSCDPITFVCRNDMRCDDMNACTVDSCDPAEGACSNVTRACMDADVCTIDSCDMVTGCTFIRRAVRAEPCATRALEIRATGMLMGDSTCALDDATLDCGAGAGVDVHFRLVLAADSDVLIDTAGTTYDAVLGIGSSCMSADDVACDDESGAMLGDAEINRTGLPAGTYFITLDGKGGETGGDWVLNVSITPS